MTRTAILGGALAAVFGAGLLGGCAFTDEALFPALSGQLGTGEPGPTASAASNISGTMVPADSPIADKVTALNNDLDRAKTALGDQSARHQSLRTRSAENAAAYQATVAAVAAKLEASAAPGDSALTERGGEAQSLARRMSNDLAAMTTLANQAASNAGATRYIVESVHTFYAGAGAGDEAALRGLDEDASKTAVEADRLFNDLGQDTARQNALVAAENANIGALSAAIASGRPYRPVATAMIASPAPRPYVVVRFETAEVDYQAALKEAIGTALARRPNAAFQVMPVPATGADPAGAEAHAREIIAALAEMGVAVPRVTLAPNDGRSAASDEVQIYLR